MQEAPDLGDDTYIVYVDDIYSDHSLNFYNETVTKSSLSDPFHKKIDPSKVKSYQRLITQLEKKFRGTEGAEKKYLVPEEVTGYYLFDAVEPPFNIELLAKIYDDSSIVHASVDARVMNTVALGWSWEPTMKAKKQIERAIGKEDSLDKVRTFHQRERMRLDEMFESFNEEESFTEVMIKVWMDAVTTGNGYLEIGRTVSGKIGYVGHIPSTHMRVRRLRDGFVQSVYNKHVFFRNFGDKETKDPINRDSNPNEVLHFKLYSPNNSYYGIPPTVSAMADIIGSKFAKEYNIDYFENKAIPRYAIIMRGVKLSEKSKKEILNYFRKEVKGKNHGTLVIPLPNIMGGEKADIEFKALENNVQEGSFDIYRKSNRDDTVSALRVPPTKIGIMENGNLAISRDADKTFKSQVIGPDQVIIEKRINRIVKELSDLFLIKFNSLDILDEDTKSRIYDRYLRLKVLSPNEVRTKIGEVPVIGGDDMLPYAIEAKLQMDKERLQQADRQFAANGKAQTPQGDPGAPVGNTNAQAGSPELSGQDNGSNATNMNDAGINAERGQRQDEGNIRER